MGRMSFLSPNHQCQRSEGETKLQWPALILSSSNTGILTKGALPLYIDASTVVFKA